MMIICTHQVCHIGRFELHKLDAGAELLFVEEHLGQQQRQQEQQQREHGRGQHQQWGEQWRCWEGGGGEDELAAEVSITLTTAIIITSSAKVISFEAHPFPHLELRHHIFIDHLLLISNFPVHHWYDNWNSPHQISWSIKIRNIMINKNQKYHDQWKIRNIMTNEKSEISMTND